MVEFQGKHVVVTGGAGGIGRATCTKFAELGASVTVLDRNQTAAEEVAEALVASGHKALGIGCDITKREEVDSAAEKSIAELGAPWAVINNAGWDIFRPFLKTTPDEWRQLVDINFIGALHMHAAFLPSMIENGGGRVVNIASDAARVGSSGEAVYAGCKAAIIAFSKTLAREHSRHGITFNVVCPGPTDTNLFAEYKEGAGNPEKLMEAFRRSIPLGRIGQPDDLPGAIMFFASEGAGFVTGQVLSVSGGLTMAG